MKWRLTVIAYAPVFWEIIRHSFPRPSQYIRYALAISVVLSVGRLFYIFVTSTQPYDSVSKKLLPIVWNSTVTGLLIAALFGLFAIVLVVYQLIKRFPFGVWPKQRDAIVKFLESWV